MTKIRDRDIQIERWENEGGRIPILSTKPSSGHDTSRQPRRAVFADGRLGRIARPVASPERQVFVH